MNPFAKAVAEVQACIPQLILQRAFVDASRFGRNTWRSSLEEQIIATVIRPRVMVDCDLIGGIEAFVPLEGLKFITSDDTQGGTVIEIPKDRTQQKSITSVISLRFSNPIQMPGASGSSAFGLLPTYVTGNNVSAQDRTALMGATAGLLASVDNIPLTATNRVDLIGENTIYVSDTVRLPTSSVLQCKLANHEDMQNLQPRYYLQFAEMVVHAVKAYIYNKLVLEIGAGELMFGQQLGRFKEIVESYADANQNYIDFRNQKWGRISIMADRPAYMRQVGLRIGGNR